MGVDVSGMLETGRDVVEEQGEVIHTGVDEAEHLGNQPGAVVGARVLHRQSRRHADHRRHVVVVTAVDHRSQRAQGIGGVRLSPAVAQERVVLRRVQERVEAVGGEELDDVQSLLVGPRFPVEALDHAADAECGTVGNIAWGYAIAASTSEIDHRPSQPAARTRLDDQPFGIGRIDAGAEVLVAQPAMHDVVGRPGDGDHVDGDALARGNCGGQATLAGQLGEHLDAVASATPLDRRHNDLTRSRNGASTASLCSSPPMTLLLASTSGGKPRPESNSAVSAVIALTIAAPATVDVAPTA